MNYLKHFENFDYDDDGEDEELDPLSSEVKDYISKEIKECKESIEKYGIFKIILNDGTTCDACVRWVDIHGTDYEFNFYMTDIFNDKFDGYLPNVDYALDHIMGNYFIQIYIEDSTNTNNVYLQDMDSYNKLRLFLLDEEKYDIVKLIKPSFLIKNKC